jgi:hypothetical protein
MQRLTTPSELAAARELRRSLTDGQSNLSTAWLRATGARVLAQESGRHLESEEASAVAEAYTAAGVRALVAIVTDVLVVDDEAYTLDATVEDLTQLSDDLAGINFLLADDVGTRCILFTADDFKLVAGPISFVIQVAGEPTMARDAFLAFSVDQHDEFQPALRRAASYMSWVGGAK